jgi:hypothetical protein
MTHGVENLDSPSLDRFLSPGRANRGPTFESTTIGVVVLVACYDLNADQGIRLK